MSKLKAQHPLRGYPNSKLKAIKIIVLILAVTFLLSGCEFLTKLRNAILQQSSQTIDSIGQRANEMREQLDATRRSVQQKVEDVQSAMREVREAGQQVSEAVDAVQRITGVGTGTTATSATSTSPGSATIPISSPSLEGSR